MLLLALRWWNRASPWPMIHALVLGWLRDSVARRFCGCGFAKHLTTMDGGKWPEHEVRVITQINLKRLSELISDLTAYITCFKCAPQMPHTTVWRVRSLYETDVKSDVTKSIEDISVSWNLLFMNQNFEIEQVFLSSHGARGIPSFPLQCFPRTFMSISYRLDSCY